MLQDPNANGSATSRAQAPDVANASYDVEVPPSNPVLAERESRNARAKDAIMRRMDKAAAGNQFRGEAMRRLNAVQPAASTPAPTPTPPVPPKPPAPTPTPAPTPSPEPSPANARRRFDARRLGIGALGAGLTAAGGGALNALINGERNQREEARY